MSSPKSQTGKDSGIGMSRPNEGLPALLQLSFMPAKSPEKKDMLKMVDIMKMLLQVMDILEVGLEAAIVEETGQCPPSTLLPVLRKRQW